MSHIAIASASVSAGKPHNRETTRTSTLIPEQLLNNAKGLVNLLQDYYNYLNTEGLPSYEINRIIDNQDIDRVSADYLDSIGAEIAKNVPNSKVLDQVSLYKKIVKFYSIRGSEESLYAFFRIFFDEIVSVIYPKERLFKLSDGDWDSSTYSEEVEIIGNLLSGNLDRTSLNSLFVVQDSEGVEIGEGQLSNFVDVDKSFDYDNVTDDLLIAFDSKENLTSTSWISNTDYPWVGELNGNIVYDEDENALRFDGFNDFIDVGAIGNNVTLTDEHTFIARIKRESISGPIQDQLICGITPQEGTSNAHDLWIRGSDGAIGTFFTTNAPQIFDTSSGDIRIQNFNSVEGFYGLLWSNAVYRKNIAYGGSGLYNGKPFYVDKVVYYSNTISIQNTHTFDENSGFGEPTDWPCALIYYDGSRWVFRGARRYIIGVGPAPQNSMIILSYSEDTDQEVFAANLEWFSDTSPYNEFVNTPIVSGQFIYSSNTRVPADGKYYSVAISGKEARKDGYVKVSVNGGQWETIISGDTSEILNITNQSIIQIGGLRSYLGLTNFSGLLTNVQYYNRALTEAEVLQVTNYYIGIAYNFYQIQFDNKDGSFINGSTLIEKNNESYKLNLLSGHEVDSFWVFDEPELNESGIGPEIEITATYDNTVSDDKQKVRWGDLQSNLFVSGNPIRHVYTTKNIGSYLDRRGFVSDINRLHDGDFWQEFSYVVNVALSSNQWENEFVRMVHPAGLKFFAAVLFILSAENRWLGPKVQFNQLTRKYESTYDPTTYVGNYRTTDPLINLEWMEGLTPPSLLNSNVQAFHTPTFQPGWLTGDLRFLELIIEALEFNLGPNDPAYQRLVLSTLHLLHISTKDRNAFAREDYLNNLKFIVDKPITQYLDIKFEDAVFNDPNIFNNIGASIDLSIIEEIRLDTEDLRDIQTEDADYLIAQGISVTGSEGSGLTANTVLNPPELDRSYSSVYNNSAPGTGLARSMLDSSASWSPASGFIIGSEYMQIDLGANKTISGVVTQGRYDFTQWVTSYKVEYSTNETNWFWVDNENVFTGNSDQNTKVTNSFTTNVSARYIKIYPVTFNGWPSMRAGVVETIET